MGPNFFQRGYDNKFLRKRQGCLLIPKFAYYRQYDTLLKSLKSFFMPDHFRGYQPLEIEPKKPNPAQVGEIKKKVNITSFRHGGGAGGQNKNKVSSSADLRLSLESLDSKLFSAAEKGQIKDFFIKNHKSQWIEDGQEIHMVAVRERDLAQNTREVIQRLLTEIEKALNPPKERDERVPKKVARIRKAAGLAAKQARRKQKGWEE